MADASFAEAAALPARSANPKFRLVPLTERNHNREQGHKMAELTINAEDVRNALNEFAASYEPGNAERVEVGRVVSASDGIARVEGLPSVDGE